jgi:anti-sigma regulatory factor (Ser/Thr protein kinase)
MSVAIVHSALLEAGETAARSARSHARSACAGVTTQDVADDVTLVVSELVTNAIRHGGGHVRLDLQVDLDEVLVAVWDAGDDFDWAVEPAQPGALTGRGLGIVAALASSCGVRGSTGPGKSVWCIVPGAAGRAAVTATGTP